MSETGPVSNLAKTWRMFIATPDIIPLVVAPFKTYNNNTRSWVVHEVDEIRSLMGRAVVLYV